MEVSPRALCKHKYMSMLFNQEIYHASKYSIPYLRAKLIASLFEIEFFVFAAKSI